MDNPPPRLSASPEILVDGDACPVKEEIYKVAFRRDVPVVIVSNSAFRIPVHALVRRVVVSDGFDAADDWIAEHAGRKSVVVTADILLAERCLKVGATVLSPAGVPFTTSSIGGKIATRAIMADLRAGAGDALGSSGGGPPPFSKADRSRFLSALDEALVRVARGYAGLWGLRRPGLDPGPASVPRDNPAQNRHHQTGPGPGSSPGRPWIF